MPAYGFWTTFANDNTEFRIGPPTQPDYVKQFDEFSDIKNIPYISMHGLSVRHLPGGKYVVANKKIDHGDMENLSFAISNKIFTGFNEEFLGVKNNTKIFKISNEYCDLVVSVYMSPETTVLDLKDANGNIVSRKRKQSETIFSLKFDAAEMVSRYLSHEHHRASLAIHGHGKIRHAADHIPENTDPAEYWPLHSVQRFVVAAPLLQL